LLILVCVVFFPNLLNLIPKAALAAILVFTGYKLAKVSLFKEYYKKGWDQFIPFVVTIICIVLTDLLKGVCLGMIVGIFYIIRSNYRSAMFVFQDNNNFLIRFKKDISFFLKPKVKSTLEIIPENAFLIIDIENAEFIDKDIVDTINEFIKHAPLKNIVPSIKKNQKNPIHQLIVTQ
jgi:MFS superfamily sulfate permease-like transporter